MLRQPDFVSTSILLLLTIASARPALATDAAANPDQAAIATAFEKGDFDKVIELTGDVASETSPLFRYRAAAFQNRGIEHFFDAEIKESISDFDAFLEMMPEEEPHHWQRGISYYYADEFEKGKAQFESHQTVNSQDVENAVFHFICAARAPGGSPEKARADFITIDADPRVPMTEIWALYAGKGTAEEVIAAAHRGNPSEEELRNRLCYAHLYLGLYFEAVGDNEESAEHIKLAAGKYRMEHYMGKVAQVHAKLRKLDIRDNP
ncbi:MAG: hypothetical protein KDN19_16585 [Verrucomicrobiae bacterium]|nr:hypothetical protein [Verrucomicrobiae bacterium]